MGTSLSTLSPNPGSNRPKKRLGRGRGSGIGKTSGKGVKGQKARPGHHGARFAFEGGQMPLVRRLPKRGFKNLFRVHAYPINVATLEKLFDAGATVDIEALRGKGILPKKAEVIKILGEGDLTKRFTVRAHRFSATARQKVEAVGGVVEIVDAAPPVPTQTQTQTEG